jgi:hypothetical protein
VGILYGGRIGWTCYEPNTLNGLRIEARGFFSERDHRAEQRLPAGTVVNLLQPAAGAILFGAAVNTDLREQVRVISGDFLFKCDMACSNSLIIAPYAGLSSLTIDQRFDVAAVARGTGQRMTLSEVVDGDYWGGAAGVEFLCRIMPTTILSIDAGVGVYDFRAERQAQQTVINPPLGTFNFALDESTSRLALAGNLRLELSQELRWCQLVLFGSAHYLDAVPEVAYGRLLGGGLVVEPSRLDTADAWGFTGGLSLRIPF